MTSESPDIVSFDEFMTLIEEFLESVSTRMEEVIERNQIKVSCTDCTEPACCYQKIMVDLYEAMVIARHLKQAGRDTPEFRERLLELGEAMEGSPTDDWLDHYVPCAFYDTETKRCTIYPIRPMVCRTHYVVSAAELCRPPSKKPVQTLDSTVFIDESFHRARAAHKAFRVKENTCRVLQATLPRAVHIALRAQDEETERGFRRVIKYAKWPSIQKIEAGWYQGNNPWGSEETRRNPKTLEQTRQEFIERNGFDPVKGRTPLPEPGDGGA